jgi:hypothetical protein
MHFPQKFFRRTSKISRKVKEEKRDEGKCSKKRRRNYSFE